MFINDSDPRLRIFKLLVSSKRVMTLSEIAKRLRIPQQNVAYHLPIMERGGIIMREGNQWFCQPIFLDDEMQDVCATKLSEIIDQFSKSNNEIFVGDGLQKEDVVINCLHSLILLLLLPDSKKTNK